MALFKIIRTADDLPTESASTRSAETQTLDFKSGYNPTDYAEMAKDIAAFANALGGAIVIGASADDDPLSYPGLEPAFAQRLSDAFADAHARHLSPKPPVVERHIFDAPPPAASGRVLLAVNVHPYADQIVGARVAQNVWRFPRRVGTDTNDLEPAMLPLFTAHVRRNIILLEKIDRVRDKVKICFRNPRNQTSQDPSYLDVKLEDDGIDHAKNVLLVTSESGPGTAHHRIPLDDIERVWDSGHQEPVWIVRVLGHLTNDGGRWTYHSNPSNTVMRT